ncbi:glycoside hydrolase family 108 protein [Sphingosinicella sp. CPCC 101087]|uniref:glycoside hydrolase family 108 protein n=1 Tax=Sphingosinicella sp. CPCC 101087 TaxID=2497754 RepID=UPI00101C5831|nr:glycosyl hydrolase 108 family protein [Sphingosinicella sp. CPCC 101087]
MSDRIRRIIDGIIEREGGYVNHPSDPGGATMYGITEAVARAAGYRGDMRAMPRSTAFQIYWTRYVVAPNFDDVAELDPKVAEELVDTGVNCGVDRAATWFQEALNALNSRQRDYADIGVDGNVGPKTLDAFRAFKRRRGAAATAIMLHAIDAFQGAHYLRLGSGNSQFEDFLNGWLAHRIRNVAA